MHGRNCIRFFYDVYTVRNLASNLRRNTFKMHVNFFIWTMEKVCFHTCLRKFPSGILVYKSYFTNWMAPSIRHCCHWILLPTLVPLAVKNDRPWSAIDITDLVCSPGRVEFSRKIHVVVFQYCISPVSRRLHVNFTLTDYHFHSAEDA